jgi:glycosyltransferase involved in cell wall biosynthesis
VTQPRAIRRLLVITYHFPPDGAVGGLRWAGFSKYLARLGWEVHIVTSAPAGSEPAVPNVHRHTPPRRATMNDAYLAVVRHLRARPAAQARGNATPASDPAPAKPVVVAAVAVDPPGRQPSLLARAIGEARLAVRLAMGFPDVGRGWVLRAAFAARGLLNEQTFDVVVTSGPPHSVAFAGAVATLGRPEALIMEMRDPWHQSQEVWGADGFVARTVRTLYNGAGTILGKRVSAVLVNTPEHAQAIRSAVSDVAVASVANGIDLELLPARTDVRLGGVSIAYVGTVYLTRNFSVVLDAIRSLAQDRPDAAASVTLHVAGHIEPGYQTRLTEAAVADGFPNLLKFHGLLPRSDALGLLSRANLALVLAMNQRAQIPAKIYECVGLGVPTLVLAESDSAAAAEARRIGAMTFDGNDVAAMRMLLEDLVDGRFPESVTPKVPISYEALALQMDAVLREAGQHGKRMRR